MRHEVGEAGTGAGGERVPGVPQVVEVEARHAELAASNQPGSYWVAAADPFAAQHAITGEVPLDSVRRVAVLTDGAARLVALFGLLDWPDVLDVLEQNGPTELIRRVRAIEARRPVLHEVGTQQAQRRRHRRLRGLRDVS